MKKQQAEDVAELLQDDDLMEGGRPGGSRNWTIESEATDE